MPAASFAIVDAAKYIVCSACMHGSSTRAADCCPPDGTLGLAGALQGLATPLGLPLVPLLARPRVPTSLLPDLSDSLPASVLTMAADGASAPKDDHGHDASLHIQIQPIQMSSMLLITNLQGASMQSELLDLVE